MLEQAQSAAVAMIALVIGSSTIAAADPPMVLRSTKQRYDVRLDDAGGVARDALRSTRIEHHDARGRIIRWEQRDAEGLPLLVWIAVHAGDGPAPERAAYWSGDALLPLTELVVSSADGRIQDVLYGDHGEKPRRQLRQYLDAAGREIYQEYFAPRSQRKYSEEIYRYDDRGNEMGRTWRRLDGTAQRVTRFDITEANEHGHWTRRLVHVDGVLDAIDERGVEYGSATRPHPAAASGPVASSREILPVPFAPGVIAARATGENALTFAPGGDRVVFTRYKDDWQDQSGYLARWRDGAWREPTPLPFDGPMYNAALAEDGQRLIFCRRDDTLGGGRVFLAERDGEGWTEPVDLTRRDGLIGSYFRLLADGTLYFHRDGDLFRCRLDASSVRDVAPLDAAVNSPDGVEFGAWVDAGEQRIIFTRSVDDAPARSGVFVAFRRDGAWTSPTRLPIPYGWSVVISPDGEDLVYTVDDDICRVPVVMLGAALEGPDPGGASRSP